MTLLEYTFLATSSLFVIVDPIAVVPGFLAMTPTDTPAQREGMARLACAVHRMNEVRGERGEGRAAKARPPYLSPPTSHLAPQK